jgi:galactose oxidase
MRRIPVLLMSGLCVAGLMTAVAGGGGDDTSGGGTDGTGHLGHVLERVPVAAAASILPRTGWTATADSAETAQGNYAAARAIDGNPATFWHTQWTPTVAALPHTLTIDMHATNTVTGLTYLPRPAGTGGNGRIGQYQIRVSTDGANFGNPVATGTFVDDATEKSVPVTSVQARYVRLSALTEAGGRGAWSSAAEINLLGTTDPTIPRTGWTVAADSQETAAANGAATQAIDGDAATFWHTQYTPTVAALPHTYTIDMHATNTVAGLTYLPRPAAGGGNGRIGQYQVAVSANGTAFTQVAAGTFVDDATPKTVAFTATQTRYVRLTALTEAGGRGPWSSMAEVNLLGAVPPPPPSAGSWSAPVGFPLVPVAAAMLRNGKILTWASYDPFTFGSTGKTVTATYTPSAGTVTQRTVTETGHDMFCPGTAVLLDGRILVNGGDDAAKTSIYDPATDVWTTGPQMTIPRGYNADATLPDGRVLTLGGSWSGGQGGKNAEVWSPTSNSWTQLTGDPVAPMLTSDPQGVYRSDNHGWFFTTTGGRVFQAGPSKAMNWYSVTGAGGVTSAGLRGDDNDAMNGNAVMYDVGKILTIGGATAYQDVDATNRAYVIDINGTATVRKVAPMANARAFANSVVLPDGKVLVVGGEVHAVPFSDDTSILQAEMWDPATETFSLMASMSVPRNYHSVALLMPDGRVFSAGGGLCGTCGTNHADAQIFTPPYLLNPDGTARSRPTITSAPASATAGTSISVTTNRAVTKFSLVRMASVTHSVDNDQRRIPLTPTATTGTTYTLPLPADRGVALPGYYMLFALDAGGVPSVAATVRVL